MEENLLVKDIKMKVFRDKNEEGLSFEELIKSANSMSKAFDDLYDYYIGTREGVNLVEYWKSRLDHPSGKNRDT